MPMRRWFEIVLAVAADSVDEAAALLDFAGFDGVEVRDRAMPVEVAVYIEADDDADAAARGREAEDALAVLGSAGPARITELDPKVWTENWKSHFARRTFAGRVEVLPPWEQPSPESAGLLSLVVNPGMAFGTGLHETTSACLELLVEEMKPGMRVADVGCGSGILALAAARLGAREVVATDVDPLAVEAAAENIATNGLGAVVRVELEPGELGVEEWEHDARPGLGDARRADEDAAAERRAELGAGATQGGFTAYGEGAFDLVAANILAETLIEMRDCLAAAVAPGGVLVLSGIESRRLKKVEEAFIQPGWHLAKSVTKGEWSSLSLHRDGLGGADSGA